MPVSLPVQGKQGRNEAIAVMTGMMTGVHVVGGVFSYVLERCIISVAECIFGTEHFFSI